MRRGGEAADPEAHRNLAALSPDGWTSAPNGKSAARAPPPGGLAQRAARGSAVRRIPGRPPRRCCVHEPVRRPESTTRASPRYLDVGALRDVSRLLLPAERK